jgi:hypothetical protein
MSNILPIIKSEFDKNGYPIDLIPLSSLRGALSTTFINIRAFEKYIGEILGPENARHVWIGDMGNAIRMTPTIIAELSAQSLLSRHK